MIKQIKKYLAFWTPLELTIDGESLTLCRKDTLSINKYIPPISLKDRLVLSLHNITVEYRDD